VSSGDADTSCGVTPTAAYAVCGQAGYSDSCVDGMTGRAASPARGCSLPCTARAPPPATELALVAKAGTCVPYRDRLRLRLEGRVGGATGALQGRDDAGGLPYPCRCLDSLTAQSNCVRTSAYLEVVGVPWRACGRGPHHTPSVITDKARRRLAARVHLKAYLGTSR